MNSTAASQLYIILMLCKIAVMFTVFYICAPVVVPEFYRQEDTFLDKLYVGFVHANFIIIVLAHVLVFLKLYEVFAMLCFSGGVYFLVYWVMGCRPAKRIRQLTTKWMIKIYDYGDGYLSKDYFKKHVQAWIVTRYAGFHSAFRRNLRNPLSFWMPLVVLLAAAYIRLRHALGHAAYSTSDSYVHLAWVKYLTVNQIYHDGVYPEGLHIIIASMSKLAAIDGYWLIRFLGPLAAVLLILSLYYFTLRVTRSSSAALITMVVYGIVLDFRFPSMVERQFAPLPQEYAAIFILPGLYFLWEYIREKKSYRLLLYAEALALTGLIHSYAALYMAIWAVVIIITGLCLNYLQLRPFLKIVGFSVGAGVVSFMPLGIGLLTGHGFFKGATDFIAKSNTFGTKEAATGALSLTNLVGDNPFFITAVAAAALLIISAVVTRERQWAVTAIPLSIIAMIMLVFYRANDLGLPQLTEPGRTGVFMTIGFAVLYGVGFYSIDKVVSGFIGSGRQIWPRLVQTTAIAICLLMVFSFTGQSLTVTFQEYDAAANTYINIRRSYPNMEWTIVGPQEQYQQVLRHGWHYDLIQFVGDFSLQQAGDANFDLPIPTRDIFVYTEKRPLFSGTEVTGADAVQELEPPGPDPFTQYYLNAKQRRILEAKALTFMETYMKTHRGVHIFYEDANMKIFHVVHDPTKFVGVQS